MPTHLEYGRVLRLPGALPAFVSRHEQTRHAIGCGLAADAAGVVGAIFITHLFFGEPDASGGRGAILPAVSAFVAGQDLRDYEV